MKRLLILLCLGLASCTDPVQAEVKIIDVYRTGFGFRQTRTVVEMPDGTRREILGRRGKEGETITVWVRGNDISINPPK